MITFPPGQDEIDPGFLDILMGAAKAYGHPLEVTSGRQGRPTTPGSMHPHGRAVDLSMAGMDDIARARLVETLRAQGIRRFGTYTNNQDMLHVDMSDAQGGNWYMHDKTNRNMGNAPAWFQSVANYTADAKPPDVRQAAATSGMSTDTNRIPSGDPVTGRAVPPRAAPMFPVMPQQAPAEQESSWATPLVALLGGLAMGGGPMEGLAAAGYGLNAAAKAENELLELKQRRADAMRRRRGQDAMDMHAQQLIASGDPMQAQIGALIQANPEAGYRLYSENQKAQMERAQAERVAQMFEDQGDHRSAALARMGGKVGTIDTKAPEGDKFGTSATTHYDEATKKYYSPRWSDKRAEPEWVEVKGPAVTQDINYQGRMTKEKSFAEQESKALPALSSAYSDISMVHDDTSRLLQEFEAGKFDADTGPLVGRLKSLWDPDVAYLRMKVVNGQLNNLQIVNLAPVTERELGLMERLGPTPDYTKPQNIEVLKELVRVQEIKRDMIKLTLDRYNKDGYEATVRNPVSIEDVRIEQARRAKGGQGQAAPAGPQPARGGDLTPEEQAELDRLRGAK